jgi:hypothetical protein
MCCSVNVRGGMSGNNIHNPFRQSMCSLYDSQLEIGIVHTTTCI